MEEPIIGNVPPEQNGDKPQGRQRGARSNKSFDELFGKLSKIKFKTAMICLGVFTAFLIFWQIYFSLISFSVYSIGLRAFIIVLLFLWSAPLLVFFMRDTKSGKSKKDAFKGIHWGWKIPAGIALVLTVLCICLAIFTTPMFMAKSYNTMINVETKSGTAEQPFLEFTEEVDDFYADQSSGENKTKVAIIDKYFAAKLGEKVLGEGSGGYGSQFEINDYTLIYYKDSLYWVGALEPRGFFQWTSSAGTGTPGYVLVDATQTTKDAKAELVTTHKLKYTPGAFLWHDAERQMYFSNMAALRENELGFELDDDGVPYYTQVIYKKKFGLTNGNEAIGLILMNATNGECKSYALDKVPEWVDNVQSHTMILQQLNYWGEYSHGYFNTWFAKKEVNNTTDGYNYVYNDGRFYITTGITAKSNDNAIVGMVLADLRTKQTKMYNMVGATEQAAMKSAEGIKEVAAAGYYASFPTLINFGGVPTFYMALKDHDGNIKMYAYVNVQEYTSKLVADEKPEVARQKYYDIIKDEIIDVPVVPSGEEKIGSFVREIVVGGTTTMVLDIDGTIYRVSATVTGADKWLVANLQRGDRVKVRIKGSQVTEIIEVLP